MLKALWRRVAPIAAPVWRQLPARVRDVAAWLVTPRFTVGVKAICLNDQDQVLLVEHRFQPGERRWSLPGGALDHGESPEEGLRREVYEETGLEIESLRPLLNQADEQGVVLIYLCRVSGDPVRLQAEELSDWRWSDLAAITLPMGPRYQRALDVAKEFLASAGG